MAIPCPFPRWRESARGRMLMCLPLIGLVEGGLWALLVWLLAKLCLPEALGALCAAAFPWLVTGFLHLDGYMDVCDDLWRDGQDYDPWTEEYRRQLAGICRKLAAEFDAVAEVICGLPQFYKGPYGKDVT